MRTIHGPWFMGWVKTSPISNTYTTYLVWNMTACWCANHIRASSTVTTLFMTHSTARFRLTLPPIHLIPHSDFHRSTFVSHLEIRVQRWAVNLSLQHKNHVNSWQVIALNYNMVQYTPLHWYVSWYKLQLHVIKESYTFPTCHKCTCHPVILLHDYGLPL